MHSASLIVSALSAFVLAACALDQHPALPPRHPIDFYRTQPPQAPPNPETAAVVPPLPPLRRTEPVPRQPAAPPAAAPAPAVPTGPRPLTACDPGGCWNPDGSRYNGGTGNSFIDRGGRLCQRNGAWMQCF